MLLRTSAFSVVVAIICTTGAFACDSGQGTWFNVKGKAYGLQNACVGCLTNPSYGPDVLTANSGQPHPNAAKFKFDLPSGGIYKLSVEYASMEERPVDLIINGALQDDPILKDVTGNGWTSNTAIKLDQGEYLFQSGENVIELQRNKSFPHIRNLYFSCAE